MCTTELPTVNADKFIERDLLSLPPSFFLFFFYAFLFSLSHICNVRKLIVEISLNKFQNTSLNIRAACNIFILFRLSCRCPGSGRNFKVQKFGEGVLRLFTFPFPYNFLHRINTNFAYIFTCRK